MLIDLTGGFSSEMLQASHCTVDMNMAHYRGKFMFGLWHCWDATLPLVNTVKSAVCESFSVTPVTYMKCLLYFRFMKGLLNASGNWCFTDTSLSWRHFSIVLLSFHVEVIELITFWFFLLNQILQVSNYAVITNLYEECKCKDQLIKWSK